MKRRFYKSKRVLALTAVFLVVFAFFPFSASVNDISPNMTNITKYFQTDYQGNGYMFSYLRNGLNTTPAFQFQKGSSGNVYGGGYWAPGINNYKYELYRDLTESNYRNVGNSLEYFALNFDIPHGTGLGQGLIDSRLPMATGINIPFTFYNYSFPFFNDDDYDGELDSDEDVINVFSMSLEKVVMYVTYAVNLGDPGNDFFTPYSIKKEFSYTDFALSDSIPAYNNAHFYENRHGVISASFNKPVFLEAIRLEFFVNVSVAEPLSLTWDSISQEQKEEVAYSSRSLLVMGQFSEVIGYSNRALATLVGSFSNDDVFGDVFVNEDLFEILQGSDIEDLDDFYDEYNAGIFLFGDIFVSLGKYDFFASLYVLFGFFGLLGALIGLAVFIKKKG